MCYAVAIQYLPLVINMGESLNPELLKFKTLNLNDHALFFFLNFKFKGYINIR